MYEFFIKWIQRIRKEINKYKTVAVDSLHGHSSDEKDLEKREVIDWYVIQYMYRKKFKLTLKEFETEPFRIVMFNLLIDSIVNDIRSKQK